MATRLKWDNAKDISGISKWDTNPYKWDDIFLLLEVIGASGEETLWNVEQLDPEDKKRFIRLVCKVKGIETYSGQKTIRDDINVTVEDVELVVKEVLGIDLTVENIHV
tara:strand:+ start:341 stop:664 length:324 start_codon:yes stop_codon:yes gene_type:complete